MSTLQTLAGAFRDSLFGVRNKVYVAKPGFSLYPTSGTNDDYAYSRHIAQPGKPKVYSFTVEWGTAFQPQWDEMERIIMDVSSGLIGFSLQALGIRSYIVTDRDTFSSFELESITTFPESFYVIYDGFAPNTLDCLEQFLPFCSGIQLTGLRLFRCPHLIRELLMKTRAI
ncbi:MAG: hypothetical protein WDO19_15535 [Bacteroidota bacterium]